MKLAIVRLLKLVAPLIGISTSPSNKTPGKRFELFRQRDVAPAKQSKDDTAG